MVIETLANPYPGPNPHVISWALDTGLWKVFHGRLVDFLSDEINTKLPEGYFAYPEIGILLDEQNPKTGKTTHAHPRAPDSGIFQTPGTSRDTPLPAAAQAPTLTLPTVEVLDLSDRTDKTGQIGLYKARTDDYLGDLVACVEVLSPTNKLPEDPDSKKLYARAGYDAYREKREQILKSGLPLVEIDLIHLQPSVIPRLGRYPMDEGTSAYSVAVIDPRPSWEKGLTAIYQFGVGDAFPLFDIPLDNGQRAPGIQLLIPFNRACSTLPVKRIDYSQVPARSETYSEADLEQIAAQIVTMQQLQAEGYTFDHGWPTAVQRQPRITATLSQIRTLKQQPADRDQATLPPSGLER